MPRFSGSEVVHLLPPSKARLRRRDRVIAQSMDNDIPPSALPPTPSMDHLGDDYIVLPNSAMEWTFRFISTTLCVLRVVFALSLAVCGYMAISGMIPVHACALISLLLVLAYRLATPSKFFSLALYLTRYMFIAGLFIIFSPLAKRTLRGIDLRLVRYLLSIGSWAEVLAAIFCGCLVGFVDGTISYASTYDLVKALRGGPT